MKQAYLLLGEILRPQGIRGEVKVKHYTDDPKRFQELQTIFFHENGSYLPQKVLKSRNFQDDVYLLLEGYTDRNAAETLRGKEIWIDREHSLPLEDNRIFIADLIGVPVTGHKGKHIGSLKEVISTGRVDIYIVDTPDGELSLPALKTVVLSLTTEQILLDEDVLQEVGLYEDRHS